MSTKRLCSECQREACILERIACDRCSRVILPGDGLHRFMAWTDGESRALIGVELCDNCVERLTAKQVQDLARARREKG